MNDRVDCTRFERPASVVADSLESYWYAQLELTLARMGDCSRLVRRRHQGPLYVHRPFYPEGSQLAHVYILHPPGGMVSGDALQTDITLEKGAQALFTTPGAGRAYRARRGQVLQQQRNHLRIAEEAGCEWFPQENIIFNGANTLLETRVELSEGSIFQGWEITVLGLPASGEWFRSGSLQQRFTLHRHGRPLLVDNLLIDDDSRGLQSGSVGLRDRPVSGVFVAGPFKQGKDLASLLEAIRGTVLAERQTAAHWGVTRQGEFIVTRYLGGCAEQARMLFIAVWQLLRPELNGRQACPPRIWST